MTWRCILVLAWLTPVTVIAEDARWALPETATSHSRAELQFGADLPLSPPPATNIESQQDAVGAPLTLADIESIALRHNPTLAASAAQVDAARGRQAQAGYFPNPVAGYHATEIGNLGTPGQQGGFVSQRIITGGKLKLDVAVASMNVNEFRWLFDAQQQRVLSDIRLRFYNTLSAQRRVELTRELAKISDDLVGASHTLVDERQLSQADLLQAEIEADQTHILFDNAQNESTEAWRRLAAVAGVPSLRKVPLVGDLDADVPAYEWEECCAIVLDQNPELAAAQARLCRAKLALQRARVEPIPDVDVFVSMRHHNVTESDVVNVQVGLPLPIFDKNQGNITAAQAEWIAASHDFKRIGLRLQDQLAAVYRRYANARQQTDRYRSRMLPRARQSLSLVTRGYDEGQVDYLTLITSQRTFIRVNLAYLDTLRELWDALSLIESQLLRGSLADGR